MSNVHIIFDGDDKPLQASLAGIDKALKDKAEEVKQDSGSEVNSILNSLQLSAIENTKEEIKIVGAIQLNEIKSEKDRLLEDIRVNAAEFKNLSDEVKLEAVNASIEAKKRLAVLQNQEKKVAGLKVTADKIDQQVDETKAKVDVAEKKERNLRADVGNLLAITTGALSLASGISTLMGQEIIPGILSASILAGVSLAQISIQAAALGTATGNLALIAAGLGIAAGLVNVVNSLRAQQRISQLNFRAQQEAFSDGMVDY